MIREIKKMISKEELEGMKMIFGKEVMSKEFLYENPKVFDAIKAEMLMRRKHGKDWFRKYKRDMEEERRKQLKTKIEKEVFKNERGNNTT